MEAIDRVIALEPDFSAAHWRRAMWLLESGDTVQAEQQARKAASIAPDDASTALVLGKLLLETDRASESIKVLEPVVARRPADRYAHFLLANAYLAAGRPDDAKRHASLAGSEPLPNWSDSWQREMLQFDVGFRARFNQAAELLAGHDSAAAVVMLESLREEQPDDHDVIVNLAIGYRKLNRVSDAIAILRSVESQFSQSAMLQFQLAGALQQQAMSSGAAPDAALLDQAQRHADAAVRFAPTMAEAQGLRGEISALRGDIPTAAMAFQTAMQLDPANMIWRQRFGGMLCLAKRWADAVAVLEVFAQQKSTNTEALYLLAAAQANSGRLSEAEATLLQALAVKPGDSQLSEMLQRVRATTSGAGATPTSQPQGAQP
jgi:predicted Zn-dependent protease